MQIAALEEMKTARGTGLTAVDSTAAAVLMTAAYSQKEMDKLLKTAGAFETERMMDRWQPGSPSYIAALERLRKEKVVRWVLLPTHSFVLFFIYLNLSSLHSLQERIQLAVHEIQDHRIEKRLQGASTTRGQSIKKRIGRRKAALLKLLNQLYLWKVIGTTESVEVHRMTTEAVSKMLETGEGPWGEEGIGQEIYWGKLAYRCRSDLERCKEELKKLSVEREVKLLR